MEETFVFWLGLGYWLGLGLFWGLGALLEFYVDLEGSGHRRGLRRLFGVLNFCFCCLILLFLCFHPNLYRQCQPDKTLNNFPSIKNRSIRTAKTNCNEIKN